MSNQLSTIPFGPFFSRLKKATSLTSQLAMAEALGINRSAVTQAKNRDAVPQKWVLQLARRYGLSPDWLEYGTGRERPGVGMVSPVAGHLAQEIVVVEVPKVAATVSAGGGSFEVGANPLATHPFPRKWLARLGKPESMVFMDVVGDSMEPAIYDGDTVLIDQSSLAPSQHQIYAVGYEDTLYVKRLEKKGSSIVLHSDNTQYAPIRVSGDELQSFRIVGKVVWLCRDCRQM